MSEEIRLELWDSLQLSDEDLLSKTTDTENNFVERKTASNTQEWLEAVVAFANSCPIGYPGVLYIGVADGGQVERRNPLTNFETLQKTLSKKLDSAWPPIYYLAKILKKDDLEFLAVLVPGSPLRPHFAGHSYVRVGPETRKASEKQFEDLIAQRSSKFRALQKLVGQTVSGSSFLRLFQSAAQSECWLNVINFT